MLSLRNGLYSRCHVAILHRWSDAHSYIGVNKLNASSINFVRTKFLETKSIFAIP
jgi:hypothetical protein